MMANDELRQRNAKRGRDEHPQQRTPAQAETSRASRDATRKRKNGEPSAGGAKSARNDDANSSPTNVDDDINFVNFARLKTKEKSLLQAQILGFMGNAKLVKLQECMKGFEYPGGIQNHSFLAQLRAGFPKKTQKNLRDEDDEQERVYEPCEHLCVDSFELSVQTIHKGRHVYVFTDAKCSKKRWSSSRRV